MVVCGSKCISFIVKAHRSSRLWLGRFVGSSYGVQLHRYPNRDGGREMVRLKIALPQGVFGTNVLRDLPQQRRDAMHDRTKELKPFRLRPMQDGTAPFRFAKVSFTRNSMREEDLPYKSGRGGRIVFSWSCGWLGTEKSVHHSPVHRFHVVLRPVNKGG